MRKIITQTLLCGMEKKVTATGKVMAGQVWTIRGYLGIIVYGIDNSWRLRSFLLALCRISQSETAEYIAYLIREVNRPLQ